MGEKLPMLTGNNFYLRFECSRRRFIQFILQELTAAKKLRKRVKSKPQNGAPVIEARRPVSVINERQPVGASRGRQSNHQWATEIILHAR